MKEKDVDACSESDTNLPQEVNRLSRKQIHAGERSFSCIQCEKSFPRKAHLVLHQRTHAGEGSFPCTHCEMSFTRKTHLLVHQRIHTGETLFSCTQCDMSFPRKANLVFHRRIHTEEKHFGVKEKLHTQKRRFFCIVCEKRFNQMAHLERHKRIHTGERPFFCSQCGKCFNQQGNLHRHQRIHAKRLGNTNSERQPNVTQLGKTNSKRHFKPLAKKPFPCTLCVESFRLKKGLLEHQQIHKKPYACNKCEKHFCHMSHLIKHRRIHICHGQSLGNNSDRGRSCTGILPRKPSPTAQEEIDSEEDQEQLERERVMHWDSSKKSHPLWGSIYAEIQAENDLNKHMEKEILEAPTVSPRPVVLKAATFIFKSPASGTPSTSPSPTLMEEMTKTPITAPQTTSPPTMVDNTTKTPILAPAFSSLSQTSVPLVPPQPESKSRVCMDKPFHTENKKEDTFKPPLRENALK